MSWMTKDTLGCLFLIATLVFCMGKPAPAQTTGVQQGNSATPRWYTNQLSFKLPFQTRVPNGVEVQLFHSIDRGRSWAFHSRVNPYVANFDYETKEEGEYWFAMRTIDRDRVAHPPGELVPGIVVYVDRKKPDFDINFETDRAGRILANWKGTDPNIDPNSINIRYTSMSDGLQQSWLRVPIAPKQYEKSETITDQIAWWPGIRAERFLIEAEIRDLAGNRSVVQRTVDYSGAMAIAGGMNVPPLGVSPLPETNLPNNQSVANSDRTPPSKDVPSTTWNGTIANSQHQVIASASTGSNMFATDPAMQNGPDTDDAGSFVFKDTGTKVPAQLASSKSNSEINGSNLLAIAQPLKTTQFELNYTVDAIGPSGVSEVQLWATQDGGKSWERWGVDSDLQSPITVNAPGEGIFGFRVVVTDKSGLVGKAPVAGDSPDVIVHVDTSAPDIKITSAPYGQAEDAGKLAIFWETNDVQLSLRPITLSYSQSPHGPWNTIEENLRDTGYYAWKTTPTTPERVYLRIDAVDQAGNENFFVTPIPIDVSGLIPRGRVQGVTPIK
jgi:hypothetical protein